MDGLNLVLFSAVISNFGHKVIPIWASRIVYVRVRVCECVCTTCSRHVSMYIFYRGEYFWHAFGLLSHLSWYKLTAASSANVIYATIASQLLIRAQTCRYLLMLSGARRMVVRVLDNKTGHHLNTNKFTNFTIWLYAFY